MQFFLILEYDLWDIKKCGNGKESDRLDLKITKKCDLGVIFPPAKWYSNVLLHFRLWWDSAKSRENVWELTNCSDSAVALWECGRMEENVGGAWWLLSVILLLALDIIFEVLLCTSRSFEEIGGRSNYMQCREQDQP